MKKKIVFIGCNTNCLNTVNATGKHENAKDDVNQNK